MPSSGSRPISSALIEFGVFLKEEAVRWSALVKASKLPKVR